MPTDGRFAETREQLSGDFLIDVVFQDRGGWRPRYSYSKSGLGPIKITDGVAPWAAGGGGHGSQAIGFVERCEAGGFENAGAGVDLQLPRIANGLHPGAVRA